MGKCPGCNAWNTLEEQAPQAAQQAAPVKANKQRPGTGASAMRLSEIPEETSARATTGIGELDRVLGGGVVEGSLMLVGGDPGHRQIDTAAASLRTFGAEWRARAVYFRRGIRAADQDARAAAGRDERQSAHPQRKCDGRGRAPLGGNRAGLHDHRLDSDDVSAGYGQRARQRVSGARVRQSADAHGQDDGLRGVSRRPCDQRGRDCRPRVLEHMVDVVLYFEGDRQHEYRILRAVKNRFGSVNELGLFEMRESGMVPVENPSELLLSTRARNVPGSCVHCAIEGSRPMLVDVQALALQTAYGTPRRTTNGFDAGRLALLLAVLESAPGVSLFNQDVYVNVAGGLELSEPAADLPLCAAVASSVRDACVPGDWAVIGEVGLAGEIRAVSQAERRLAECARLGFTTAVIPRENARHLRAPEGMRVYGVETLAEALAILFG